MPFKISFSSNIRRYSITALVILIAALAGYRLWVHYEYDPWTRDGRVKADVIQMAPDVTGQVTKVFVRDNEKITKGQVLFEIDRDRFALELRRAQANELAAKTELAQARREDRRNRELKDLVANEVREQGQARMEAAQANLEKAIVARDAALLDLQRSKVASTVNGYVTNLSVHVGTYVKAGVPVLALLDEDSFYVEGYFEETKITNIQKGDPVLISLMGEGEVLKGHIDSIAGGIFDRERSTGSNLLQNINPTLNWVRLVQRIPVRIAIDEVPENVRLIAGQTATIQVRKEMKAGTHEDKNAARTQRVP